jgi:hypothetical protein
MRRNQGRRHLVELPTTLCNRHSFHQETRPPNSSDLSEPHRDLALAAYLLTCEGPVGRRPPSHAQG